MTELMEDTSLKIFDIPGSPIQIRNGLAMNHRRYQRRTLSYNMSVHGVAHGQFVFRHPELSEGQRLEKLKVEMFAKTIDMKWRNHKISCDYPLFVVDNDLIQFFKRTEPVKDPILTLRTKQEFSNEEIKALNRAHQLALHAFTVLERDLDYALNSVEIDFELESEEIRYVDIMSFSLASSTPVGI